ncbi:MAG: hypothetical protein IJB32_04385 [Clostridia bacterium]|nr:hypothetical protein [Clostridia bacterium]
MKKALKIFLGVAMLAVAALSCVACSVETWVDQMVCDHEYDGGVITKESTCAEFGELTKTCSICGKTEVENIDKKDHTVILIEEVAPTCVKTGLTSGTKCSVCDIVITEPQEVPAMGHKVVKDDAISATCLTSGLTEGSHCGRCDEVLNKQTVVPAHGHKLISYEQVDPTCFEDGHSAYSACTECNVKYGYEFYAGGHKLNALGHCSVCDLIDTSVITLENLNNEEYFTKRELKVGDVIELDKVVLYSVVSNVVFKTIDNESFGVSEIAFEASDRFPTGNGINPSTAEFFYKIFDNPNSDCYDYLLHFPKPVHLFYEHSDSDICIDYQFTDMTVTITSIDLYDGDNSAVYVYTPVA